MNTVNLSLHITGPAWAWWTMAGAISLWALSYALNVAARVWLQITKRKVIAAAIVAQQRSVGMVVGGVSSRAPVGRDQGSKGWTP